MDTDAASSSALPNYQRLANGFAYIRHKRPPFLKKKKSQDAVPPPPPQLTPEQVQRRSLTLEFLDPGAKLRASLSGASSHKKGKAGGGGDTEQPDIYEKLTTLLQTEYQNTVPQLAYQDVRSKAQNRIDAVQVKCHKLESVVLLEEIPASATAWHTIPACHVYLISCRTVEDYRQRVKPSIQAFVSQLTDQRNRPYVLVYCPTTDTETSGGGSESNDGETSSTTTSTASTTSGTTTAASIGSVLAQRPAARAGLALANRMRQRFHAAQQQTSGGSSGGGNNHDDDEAAAVAAAASVPDLTFEDLLANRLAHLTRSEREVYRRLQADFGPMCALSVPSMDPQCSASFKKTEWTAFLQTLAAALARGLEEHCQKYNEALRQLDAQRAHEDQFDVAQYFLVKESWAFLFEQYNLPAEALLQYKEARILLPDIRTDDTKQAAAVEQDDILSGIAGTETRRRHRQSSSIGDDLCTELTNMVEQHDLEGFRRQLAGIKLLEPLAPALEDYLYVRETDLLFQMVDPIEVLLLSLAYVTAMVDFRLAQVAQTEHPADQIKVHEWAFLFCWDLKEASRSYLPDSAVEDTASSRRPIVESFGRIICDILAYARLRLLKMAKIHGTDSMVLPVLSIDLQSPWEPWKNPSASKSSADDMEPAANGLPSTTNSHDSRALLKDAFASGESFADCYLTLMKVAIAYNTLAGRRRAAARLRLEVVEIYVQRGLVEEAAATLKTTAAVYEQDGWMECSFLLLFRLAGFQRRISSPDEYFPTLLKCFAVGHRIMVPPKAIKALQTDLDAVLKTDAVKGLLLEASPIFVPVLGLSGVTSFATGVIRNVCSVGEEASVFLRLSSYFSESIDDVSIKIDLVSYQAHVLAAEEGVLTNKSDVVRVLSLDSNVELTPGENEFKFSWIPLSSGQFTTSCIELEWKGIRFVYTNPVDSLTRPMVRIDILPAAADQSMSITPMFLVPGHEQPLRIDFSPGLDDVESGEIHFDCSPGLRLLPPGGNEEDWSADGKIPLPPCERRKPISVTVNVKSVDSEEQDSATPTVHLELTTQYRSIPAGVSDEDAGKHESAGVLLDHHMHSKVSTLPSSSLTVKNVVLSSHKIGEAFLGLTVLCHTPTPFTIHKWNLELPAYLTLKDDGGDINTAISGTIVREGDMVHFGFLCDLHLEDMKSSNAAMVVDISDEHGYMFHERLDLRLRRNTLPRMVLPDIQVVPVKMDVASDSGLTGVPVGISYSFETSVFSSWKGQVIYDIANDNTGWIVNGSCRGLVDRDQPVCKLDFMAIPVQPGQHASLPDLIILLDGEGLERPFPVTVRVTNTPTFKAQSPSTQSMIVYPTFEL